MIIMVTYDIVVVLLAGRRYEEFQEHPFECSQDRLLVKRNVTK